MGRTKKPTEEQLAEAEVLNIEVIGNIGSVALQKLIDAKNQETPEVLGDVVDPQPGEIAPEGLGEDITPIVDDGVTGDGELPEPTPEPIEVPTEEPTPEPTKAVNPEEKVVEGKLKTLDDVKNLLAKPGMSIKDKLNLIKDEGPTGVRGLVSKLYSYNEQVGPKAPNRGMPFVAGKNYDLYNTLKQVVETKDQKTFRIKMDIVNLMFLEYADEGFKDVMLLRGDTSWKWGEKALNTYNNLITIICNLANLETRAKIAKNIISPDKATDIETTTFTEVSVTNIRKYYT